MDVSEPGTAALRVWQTSGNQVAAIPLEVMRQMKDVRGLKKRLEGVCGLPSFRQQLLHDGAVLDDETKLARLELPVDLQLVLLSFGSVSQKQRNEFSFAVARGRTSEVQRMLQSPQDPDLADEAGETPLLVATKHGHAEVALLLLEAGADVNLPNRRGWTALTRSSAEGRVDFVRLLLEAGADTECAGGESNEAAALFQAVQHGHVGVVRLLLGSRANVALRSKSDGQTPLTRASLSGHTEIACLLLKSRAEVDAADDCGATALMFASSRGNADIVSLLLEARAGKDMVTTRGTLFLSNKIGQTALIQASYAGRLEVVRLLLRSRADTKMMNCLGESALSCATQQGQTSVVQLLRASNAP